MRHTIETVYREHRRGLFALALSITRRGASAEDAVHDAVVRLCQGAHRIAGDPVPYVYTAVRNAAIDRYRKAQRPTPQALSMFNGAPPDPAAAAIEAEQRDRLQDAVEALPDGQRQVVVMKTYAGLTFQQVGEVVGESANTVSSRYYRALERLKQAMEDPS